MNKWICCLMSPRNGSSKWDDVAVFILRAFAGLTMAFAHGFGKLPPPEQLVQGVEAIGFPMPGLFAWSAALAEFAGGLLLAMGLFSRPAALMMAFTMAVAGLIVHAADPFQIKELAFVYFFISLFFVLHGPGRLSLDAVFSKKVK